MILLDMCWEHTVPLELLEFVAFNALAIAPWFFLSIGLGVVVRTLRLADGMRAAFRRRPIPAILLAVAIGAFAPFCSCTVVPVVAGLLTAGIPLAPVMSFWVASPTMDPEIFTFTVSMLGWELATVRLVATLVLSTAAGVGVHVLSRRGSFQNPLLRQPDAACGSDEGACPSTNPERGGVAVLTPPRATIRTRVANLDIKSLVREIGRESWMLGRWLLVAFALEGVILETVPQEAIAATLGGANAWSVPLAAVIGVPLYVSNFTALPIVSGLLGQGMSAGAAIAFLLAGPVTTIPAMLAVRSLVRRDVFVYYLAVGLVGATALGFLTGAIL
ncbi:MAG: permease [Acidimicrobiia bacterium]